MEPIHAAASEGTRELPVIEQKNFNQEATINNKWMPLEPATQFVYRGSTVEDGKIIPHRVVLTVTDLVKVIDDIPTLITLTEDFVDEKLTQQTLGFLAQDNDGNVWKIGEYRETFSGKGLIGGRPLIIGHPKGVRAGVMLFANPGEGTATYSEGFAPPPYELANRRRVRKLGEKITVPAGTYNDVLVIEEFSEHEPGALRLEYYAPGVGEIRVGWEGKAPEESLELVKVLQLEPQDMDEKSALALAIEERAYVYSRTKPAQRGTR